MSVEQVLEEYIIHHPDYWEFEDELQEVKRLKSICNANMEVNVHV